MPLKQSASKAAREENIRELVKRGHPPRRAVAAAYDVQRRAAAKKGGPARRASPEGKK